MKHLGTLNLETERLLLRRFNEKDAFAAFNNWMNDDEVTKFLTWKPHGNIDVTKSVIGTWCKNYSDKEFYNWVIEIKNTGEIIGNMAIVNKDDNIEMVHSGYCIGKKWWHKGYTSEAYARIIKFFFEDVKINRLEAYHDLNNPNSGKVMEKCGLKLEGIIRQGARCNQGISDIALYSMIKSDYFSN